MVKHVAIIHPDLGIGGAEQLIVNIALALQLTDHKVTIFTPRHDKTRCFKPTSDGQISVKVRGSIFPATILGKGTAFCSLVRMFLASLYVVMFGGKFDFIIVDQVSAILPIFWLTSSKVVFYCHYPDQLLCTERSSVLKRMYRAVMDKIEEIGLRQADFIYVNSNFTKKVTQATFKSLQNRSFNVLYPCISLDFPKTAAYPDFLCNSPYFFSLNRYERKKNINLAIESYSLLSDKSTKLLIGGGFDPDLTENREHLNELIELCKKHKLNFAEVENWSKSQPGADVYFAKNLSETQREEALRNTIAVLYTPENEHFGIVPVEAMARGTPVIAINSGGPVESVKDGKSGFLLDKDPKNWSQVMERLKSDERLRQSIKKFAAEYACKEFSLNFMGDQLAKELSTLLS